MKSKVYWALHLVEWQIDNDISEKLIASFFMVHQSEFYNLCTFYQENVITLNILEMFIIAVKKSKIVFIYRINVLGMLPKPIRIIKIFSSRNLTFLCELPFF